jgi:hypothetical protein
MRARALWVVPPCLAVLCCTVEDRPLEIVSVGTGGAQSAAGSGQGGSANEAGDASGVAGEPASGGTRPGGGNGGSAQAGSAGSGQGGTLGEAGMRAMSDGGVGDLPEGQGTDCALPPPACYDALSQPALGGTPLIDDFEDGDLCAKQHLRGYWFPYGAGAYHIAMSPNGHNSAHALELSGDAHAGVAVRPNGSQFCDEQAFDLSSYTGVEFWVRTVSGKVEVSVSARDAGTLPGGDEFGTTLFSPFQLVDGNAWQQVSVAFATMKDSKDRLFDPSTTKILKLEAPNVDPPSFAVLLDDVTFY